MSTLFLTALVATYVATPLAASAAMRFGSIVVAALLYAATIITHALAWVIIYEAGANRAPAIVTLAVAAQAAAAGLLVRTFLVRIETGRRSIM